MSRLAKVSKYRHTAAHPAKPDNHYRDLKCSSTIWDCSNLIAANSKYFAVAWAAASASKVVVLPLDKPGKCQASPPCLLGHTGAVIDWSFHPFNDSILVTASEDTTLKVWSIPDGGLTEDMNDPMVTHEGHTKKVGVLSWHPSAEHVLASASMDHTIKLWDIERGERGNIACHTDQINSVNWNLDGSLINTTSKDKKVRIIDVRSGEVVSCSPSHEGPKTQRSIWAKRRNQIVTVGFAKDYKRQVMVWDVKNMSTPLHVAELEGQSVPMPFYDEDTSMLYVGGKGDSSVTYFELWDEQVPITELDTFSSGTPAKGMCFLPKYALDIQGCELARMLKLESNVCIPVSFKIPRRTGATEFQSDIYPPTFSNSATMTSSDFFGGKNAEPQTMDLRPFWEGKGEPGSPGSSFKPATDFVTPAAIQGAEEKVKKLEADLAAAQKELEDLKKLQKEQQS